MALRSGLLFGLVSGPCSAAGRRLAPWLLAGAALLPLLAGAALAQGRPVAGAPAGSLFSGTPQARPVANAAQDDLAVLIADRVRVEGEDLLVAEGTVEVMYRTTRLRAARITYDRRGGRLSIEGPIVMTEGGRAVLLASAAELSDDLRNGVLGSARVVLDEQLQMAASRVRRVDGRYTELRNTVASSCQVCAARPVPLWSIRADRIVHDSEEQKIWFENATFRIGRLPVMWIPRMSLPDPTVKRMTGFLNPEVRTTSQLGYGLKIPYFITLGPSRDLLLRPYVSSRTRTLELRYREEFRSGGISFEGAASRDSITNGSRGYLFGGGEFRLPRDYRFRFRIEASSDPAYLLDYGYSGKDRLMSYVRIERFRRDERFVARIINFATLRDDEIAIEDTLPYLQGQVGWERRIAGILGGEARIGVNLDGHQRRSSQDMLGRDVLRLGAEASWRAAAVFGPGIEAEVLSRLTVDSYWVSEDSRWPGRFTHTVPAVTATLRWPLAGQTASGALSVIEPVAQIAWSRSIGTAPPNEDSVLVEFDEGNLLSIDRFPGNDRRETGLRGVFGVNWSRIGPDWSFGLSLGRIVRAEPATGFTRASGLGGASSDWLLAGRIAWDNRLSLTGRMILDEDSGVAKAETRLAFRSDRISLALGHVYLVAEPAEGRTTDTNEITFDSDWNASRHWYGSTGIRYDAQLDRASNASFGLGYRNECVSAALSLSRRFTSSTSVRATTSVGLTVSLNGFGTDGRAYRRTCAG